MSFTGGLYTDAELKAPGAWDQNNQSAPPVVGNKMKNANHLAYDNAIAVQERSASRCFISNMNVRQDGTAIKIVDRVKGRKWVMIKVQSSQTVGAYLLSRGEDNVGPTGTGQEAEPEGWLIVPGDPPLFLPTEASIWATTQTIGSGTILNIMVGIATEAEYEQ